MSSAVEDLGPLVPGYLDLCLERRGIEEFVIMCLNSHNAILGPSCGPIDLSFHKDLNIGLIHNHYLWVNLQHHSGSFLHYLVSQLEILVLIVDYIEGKQFKVYDAIIRSGLMVVFLFFCNMI